MADLPAPLAETLEVAHLHFSCDDRPGIRREAGPDGFVYRAPDGSPVTDERTLARIASLAIPPAWTSVWVCRDPNGHVQATGRDAKGRKQYRYHARWRQVRDEAKFDKLHEFGLRLPGLRDEVDARLRRQELDRDRVLALVTTLLDATLIRVGNEEYAVSNRSYGLTTLRKQHAEVQGDRIVLAFRGKSGQEHEVQLRDRRLARAVSRCLHIPGQHLFRYRGRDGEWLDVSSTDVNEFLHRATGMDATAKDFRTWGGTVEAVRALTGAGVPETAKEAERAVLAAVDAAAERLGNTRAVARASYVHPEVLDAYRSGALAREWRKARPTRNVDRAERATLRILDAGAAAQVAEAGEERTA